jgi:thioredoxin-related protein
MNRISRLLAFTLLLAPAIAQGQVTKTRGTEKGSIYNPNLDAREQVKTAGVIASRDNQRILVMFGGDWCGWCHKLHELFKSDREIRKILLEDYKLVMVDTKAPNAEALQKECQGDLKDVGYPFLAVLSADGKVLKAQKTDPLEEGDHHDPKKVREFLTEWAPAKQTAAQVVEAGIAKAASEDKLVFLHFGAPWCGWCHKLDEFLAREDIAGVFGKEYVDVKVDVDRMVGGKEVEAKYRKNPNEGIPWFVVLDAKAEALANADGPKGNIGYPAAPEEIAHFIAVLKKTAKKLDAKEFEAIEAALKAAPEAKSRAER